MTTTSEAPSRFPQDRHQRMAALIADRGQMSIVDLIRHFGISGPTARRDVAVLARAGLATRMHGGVLAPGQGGAVEPLFLEKLRVHQALKSRIGSAAAAEIRNGQTVVLDSGTTALAVARALAGRPVSIVTMDLKVAEAAANGETEVSILGGQVRNGYFSLVGDQTTEALAAIRADVFFLSADAIDENGVTNVTEAEAIAKRAAIACAERTILVADHSKLGRREAFPVCAPGDVAFFLTDRGAGPKAEAYRNHFRRIELH